LEGCEKIRGHSGLGERNQPFVPDRRRVPRTFSHFLRSAALVVVGVAG